MKRVIAAAAAAGLLSFGLAAPASADSDPVAGQFDLITNGGSVDTSIDIGDVVVNGLEVTVTLDPSAKYVADNPNPIYLTHIAAEAQCSEGAFPLSKKGNLTPGQMDYQLVIEPGDVGPWTFELADPGCEGTPLIAVHADAVQDAISGIELVEQEFVGQPVKFKVALDTGNDPDASYFDTTFTGTLLNGQSFDGYCIDIGHTISPGTQYTGTLAAWDGADTGNVDKPENLPAVAWLINSYSPGDVDPTGALNGNGTPRLLTSGDLQRAIWYLVDVSQSTAGLGSYRDATAKFLRDEALAAQAGGFTYADLVETFGCGAQIPVIVLPDNGGVQTTLVQTTFVLLDIPCEGYEGGSGTAMALDTSKTEAEGGNVRYGNQFDGDNWFGYVKVEAAA